MSVTDVATDAQRFPIGRFTRLDSYTVEQRADHIARLAAQPANIAAAAHALSTSQLDQPYRPGGWTSRQLVHHVADSHVNCYIRLKLALTEDEPTIKPYDQDAWVTLPDVALPIDVSLALLEATHTRMLVLLRAMTPEQFARPLQHPENGRMTLDQLVALYAWHGDHHTAHLVAARG
jgi:uncharacterized damage-inducible protein DinB